MTRPARLRHVAPVIGALCLAVISGSVGAAEPRSRDRATSDAARAAASSPNNLAAGTGRREGIDVSSWQSVIHWRKVKADGVDFAILKATEGYGWIDRQYQRNHRRARAHGIRVTAYHFARPDRSQGDARREADFFIDHANLRPSDLVPALDLETTGGLSRRELTRWTLHFMRRVYERIGVKPMVYTSPWFWQAYLGDTARIARRGFKVVWVAHWGTPRPRVPAERWAGHGWTFWQWTARGRIDGIRGNVDRNWFNGTDLSELSIRTHRLRAGG